MPLTPDDVSNVAFKKPPMGKRGYDEEEVDAFLDEVERDLVSLYNEREDLRAQIAQAASAAPDGATDPRLTEELAHLQGEIERVQQEKALAEHAVASMQAQVAQAQQEKDTAEHAAAAAYAELEQARAQGVTVGGEQQALRVLTMAQQTAEVCVNDARSEAERLLTDANFKAEQAVRDALVRAEALDRESRQRHEEAMGDLAAQRLLLENRVQELKQFEQEYRARLKAFLEAGLSNLDGMGSDQNV